MKKVLLAIPEKVRPFVYGGVIVLVAGVSFVFTQFLLDGGVQRLTATFSGEEYVSEEEAPRIPLATVVVPEVSAADYRDGDANAPITIIEYSDLECPFCKQNQQIITDLKSEFPGKISRVFRHLPLTRIHPAAPEQARYALCVAQSAGAPAYYAFIRAVFLETTSSGRSFSSDQIAALAASASGESASEMTACSNAEETQDRLQGDIDQAATLGLTSTPSAFIITKNGTYFARGAYPLASLRRLVNEVL